MFIIKMGRRCCCASICWKLRTLWPDSLSNIDIKYYCYSNSSSTQLNQWLKDEQRIYYYFYLEFAYKTLFFPQQRPFSHHYYRGGEGHCRSRGYVYIHKYTHGIFRFVHRRTLYLWSHLLVMCNIIVTIVWHVDACSALGIYIGWKMSITA